MHPKTHRMRRIFRPDGRTLVVAMDHAGFMGPVAGLIGKSAEYLSCFGPGTIRKELVRNYGSPFAVESAHEKPIAWWPSDGIRISCGSDKGDDERCTYGDEAGREAGECEGLAPGRAGLDAVLERPPADRQDRARRVGEREHEVA